MRFRFIHTKKAAYPLSLLCRVLRVSTKGYYSWLERGEPVSPRRTELDQAVQEIHRENRRRYGSWSGPAPADTSYQLSYLS